MNVFIQYGIYAISGEIERTGYVNGSRTDVFSVSEDGTSGALKINGIGALIDNASIQGEWRQSQEDCIRTYETKNIVRFVRGEREDVLTIEENPQLWDEIMARKAEREPKLPKLPEDYDDNIYFDVEDE